MTPTVRLALVVHNHQPIGNFDAVVDRAYRESYLPLLRTFARFPRLRFALHLSGSLFDWLAERRPEYLDEVAALVRQQRVQVLGGAYYEPILPMIARRDRLGQIRSYQQKLAERFGEAPTGFWLPERVWEQQLVGDLAACGIDHTILDDFHFRAAGLGDDRLRGYYLTEDDGRLLAVLPGNERLRYQMPFTSPEEIVEHLRGIAQAAPGATVVFADDGEKFGSWPGTYEHCHERGWLHRFCEALAANPWIETTTPADVVRSTAPLGKIYLPDASYREMTEWSSLGDGAVDRRLQAGTWRNFLVKYPEAGAMYARMQMVSDRVDRAEQAGYPADIVAAAKQELYKAQCNCAYWHGTFGGVYLSHLRQAIYRHLIRADDLLDRTADRPEHWVEAVTRDHNLDVRPEVCLAGDRLMAFLDPHDGGRLYELDLRGKATNVLATVARRAEPYHAEAARNDSAPIDVRQQLAAAPASDARPRHCLVEHFYAERPTLEEIATGRAIDLGDFADGSYKFRVEQKPEAARVRMWRHGTVDGRAIKLTKTVTLAAGGEQLTCDYLLENLPVDRGLHFAVEFNFAGCDDSDGSGLQQAGPRRLGSLGTPLEFANLGDVRLVDAAAGVSVGVESSRPASFWTYPIRVVNRCERGFETTHQGTCVVPNWLVRGDAQGKWGVTLTLPVAAQGAEALRRNATLGPSYGDLGDALPQLTFPRVEIVTHTETIRSKPEVRRKTTRRLKAAG
jgi:hypothetical protein